MGGWTIFADTGSYNGQADSGEPSAVTEADGSYSLTGLAPGTYRVREVPQPGWFVTSPPTGYYDITISAGERHFNVDFGNREEETLPPEAQWDFGDAPYDPQQGYYYPTLLAQNGARHRIVSTGPWLGDASSNDPSLGKPDAEADGQPTIPPVGDDVTDKDDERCLEKKWIIVAGRSSHINVQVGGGGYLDAWMDFNGDGTWQDPDERISKDYVSPGLHAVAFATPADAVVGATFVRFRISTKGGLSPEGAAEDGEVEDHIVRIDELDWGDAPEPYPTKSDNNGAANRIDPKGKYILGSYIDAEVDGQPSQDALGDDEKDKADEDGVTIPSVLTRGQSFTISVSTPLAGYLGAWIDWNGDHVWDQTGSEQVISSSPLASSQTYLVTVPAGAKLGPTYARFRMQESLPLSPMGISTEYGEVEDYMVTIVEGVPAAGTGEIRGRKFNDLNGDGNGEGDPGLGGVTIFLDLNGNGTPDEGEPATTTGRDGAYSFTGLGPGMYAVDEVVPPESWQTYPTEGGDPAFWNVSVGIGETVDGIDFGNHRTATPVAQEYSSDLCFNVTMNVPGLGIIQAALSGPSKMHIYIGSAGQASDVNGNGFDEVITELTDLDLTGVDPTVGKVRMRLDPSRPSTGVIEEQVNNTPGLLDIPAVTQVGSGDSLIDLFFEIELTDLGICFRSEQAIELTSVIGQLPQAVSGHYSTTLAQSLPLYKAPCGDASWSLPVPAPTADASLRGLTSCSPATPKVESDWGDAPEGEEGQPIYPTTKAKNGAANRVGNQYLGAAVTADQDGQPDPDADADSGDDGVTFDTPLVPGSSAKVTLILASGKPPKPPTPKKPTVTSPKTVEVFVRGWIDFNRDGQWDNSTEKVVERSWTSAPGTCQFTFTVPPGTTLGITYARFRLQTGEFPSPAGVSAYVGEVEDYQIEIGSTGPYPPTATKYDYGDAPNDGVKHFYPDAWHELGGPCLGATPPDAEKGTQATPPGLGDDITGKDDDEDGLWWADLTVGWEGRVDMLSRVPPGTIEATMAIWIDFNGDGDWDKPGEEVAWWTFNKALPSQDMWTSLLWPVQVPNTAKAGPTYARLRIYDGKVTSVSPGGDGGPGEVEDHLVFIKPKPMFPVRALVSNGIIFGEKFNDLNRNGTFDLGELLLSGWTIWLDTDNDGQRDEWVQTDDTGLFMFTGLAPGTYTVGEDLKPGWTQTCPEGGTHSVTIEADQTEFPAISFGNQQAPPQPIGRIMGGKFDDLDGDGKRGSSEPGVANWPIWLDDNGDGRPERTTTTDDTGSFSFDGLGADTYKVGEETQGGWTQTLPGTPSTYIATIPNTPGIHVFLFDFGNQGGYDFGDAPDDEQYHYCTKLANNGARHRITARTYLGKGVDAKLDGQPYPPAGGDDGTGMMDEDGVTFDTLFQGKPCTAWVTPSVDGFIDAWVDFNIDGDWEETDEHIFASKAVVGGQLNSLIFAVPGTALTGLTYARFRFSLKGGLSYYGDAPDGEVEDYPVDIIAPKAQPPEGPTLRLPISDVKWSQPAVGIGQSGLAPVVAGWDEPADVPVIWFDCWDCPTQCHADADCDGKVDAKDLALLEMALGHTYPAQGYDACADFDKDLDVDMADLSIFWGNYGTFLPAAPGCPGKPVVKHVLADDWFCVDKRPVTDIHWWGSFLGWSQGDRPPEAPTAFHIGIWTDVREGPGNNIWPSGRHGLGEYLLVLDVEIRRV